MKICGKIVGKHEGKFNGFLKGRAFHFLPFVVVRPAHNETMALIGFLQQQDENEDVNTGLTLKGTTH